MQVRTAQQEVRLRKARADAAGQTQARGVGACLDAQKAHEAHESFIESLDPSRAELVLVEELREMQLRMAQQEVKLWKARADAAKQQSEARMQLLIRARRLLIRASQQLSEEECRVLFRAEVCRSLGDARLGVPVEWNSTYVSGRPQSSSGEQFFATMIRPLNAFADKNVVLVHIRVREREPTAKELDDLMAMDWAEPRKNFRG